MTSHYVNWHKHRSDQDDIGKVRTCGRSSGFRKQERLKLGCYQLTWTTSSQSADGRSKISRSDAGTYVRTDVFGTHSQRPPMVEPGL